MRNISQKRAKLYEQALRTIHLKAGIGSDIETLAGLALAGKPAPCSLPMMEMIVIGTPGVGRSFYAGPVAKQLPERT